MTGMTIIGIGTPKAPTKPALLDMEHLRELADCAKRCPRQLNDTELWQLGDGVAALDLNMLHAEQQCTQDANRIAVLIRERDAARERIDALEEQLEEAKHDAALARAEAKLLRRELERLNTQPTAARYTASYERLSISFELACQDTAGDSYTSVASRLTAAVQSDSARLVDWMSERDAARRIAPPMPVFDLSDCDAVVVDVP